MSKVGEDRPPSKVYFLKVQEEGLIKSRERVPCPAI